MAEVQAFDICTNETRLSSMQRMSQLSRERQLNDLRDHFERLNHFLVIVSSSHKL